MIQYEHVVKLAELQASIEREKVKADEASARIDAELNHLKEMRANTIRPYIEAAEEMQTTAESLKQQIVQDWDGKDKTTIFEFGTLRLRTTKTLVVNDESAMLTDIIKHLPADRVMQYIKGFKLTELKSYLVTFPQPDEITETIYKTTASLKLLPADERERIEELAHGYETQ